MENFNPTPYTREYYEYFEKKKKSETYPTPFREDSIFTKGSYLYNLEIKYKGLKHD